MGELSGPTAIQARPRLSAHPIVTPHPFRPLHRSGPQCPGIPMKHLIPALLSTLLLAACATTGNENDGERTAQQTRKSDNCQEIIKTGSRLPQRVCSSAEIKTERPE